MVGVVPCHTTPLPGPLPLRGEGETSFLAIGAGVVVQFLTSEHCRMNTLKRARPVTGEVKTRVGGQAVRMIDVAKAANVSLMTVSRALNDPSKLSEDTRKLVLDTV